MITPFQIRFDEGGTYIQVPELDPPDRSTALNPPHRSHALAGLIKILRFLGHALQLALQSSSLVRNDTIPPGNT
jgi:hypothetical protein